MFPSFHSLLSHRQNTLHQSARTWLSSTLYFVTRNPLHARRPPLLCFAKERNLEASKVPSSPYYTLSRRETLKYKTVLHQHIIFYSKLILTFNCLLIFPSLSLSIFASQSCHFASTCHHEMSTCTRPPPSSHPSRCCKCLCRWQAITWSYCCRPFALGKHRTCVTTVVLPILLFQLCSLRLGSRHQITSISPGSNLPSSSPRNQQRSGCPT